MKLVVFGFCLVFSQFLAYTALAATEYQSPSSGTYAVGSTFSVSVYASSPDQPASAFSAYLSFPTDKLNVTSLSKNGSIISVWVQEPTYSNSGGTIGFEGFIPNPGYTGTGGKLLTITFQVKAEGTANVNFTSAAVLANDGYGTNITSGTGSGSFTLGAAEEPAETPPPPPSGPTVPGAPTVTSATHPNSNSWYTNNDPTFTVAIPSGTTGVNVLANQSPSSDPGTTSDGLGATYSYPDVEDGVWYFHARLQNAQGWGAVTHYRFQIDSVAPEPFTLTLQESDKPGISPAIIFDAHDLLSGVDRYVISVDGTEVATLLAADIEPGEPYGLPAQVAGVHTVRVDAYDRAGNTTSSELSVTFTEDTKASPLQEPAAVGKPGFWSSLVNWVEGGLAIILGLLILGALIFAAFMVRHLYREHGKLAGGRHTNGSSRLHHNLKHIRHNIRASLRHLESTRRTKHLSDNSEKVIRSTMRSLKDLEDKIVKAMDDV